MNPAVGFIKPPGSLKIKAGIDFALLLSNKTN